MSGRLFSLFKYLTSMFKFHLQDMYNVFKSRILDIIAKKKHRTVGVFEC